MPKLRSQLQKITNYRQWLDDRWLEHINAKPIDAPTVISTFAGAGGSSLGYSMSGFHELLAVEMDDNAVATFRKNFNGVPVYHGDIAGLSIDYCKKLIGNKELDVLDGSPPCQGFSTSKVVRNSDDPRNSLYLEFVRLLIGLKPRCFVMENVLGMVSCNKGAFATILSDLKSVGYRVSVRLMNASYFAVPQVRERLIFIGFRNDLGIEPSHPDPEFLQISGLDAITDIPKGNYPVCTVTQKTIDIMKSCLPGKKVGGNSYYSWFRAGITTPCYTIQKSLNYGKFSVWHPIDHRPLNGREVARLGGWPDQFQFIGDIKDWVARIGNSVPPPLMRSIATHIKKNLNERI